MEKDKNNAVTKPGGEISSTANASVATIPKNIAAIFEKSGMPTHEEMISIRDWFADYFTKTFRMFDRKTVGRKISPGDAIMEAACATLHMIAPCLPKDERAGVFIPLNVLLKAIAERWDDAAAPALAAIQHVHELENIACAKTDVVYQWAKSGETRRDAEKQKRAQRVLDEYAAERAELKKALGAISAALLNANPDELKEILERIESKVDAVQGTANETQAGVNLTVKQGKAVAGAARDMKEAAEKMSETQSEIIEQFGAVADTMNASMSEINANAKATREAAKQAAVRADIAAHNTGTIAKVLSRNWDGFIDELRKAGYTVKTSLSDRRQKAVLKLWDEWNDKKLDKWICDTNGIDQNEIGRRTDVNKFMDYCGGCAVLTDENNGTMTLAEIVTADKMKRVLHNASVKKNQKKKAMQGEPPPAAKRTKSKSKPRH